MLQTAEKGLFIQKTNSYFLTCERAISPLSVFFSQLNSMAPVSIPLGCRRPLNFSLYNFLRRGVTLMANYYLVQIWTSVFSGWRLGRLLATEKTSCDRGHSPYTAL